jgi:hypothetical protein
MEPISYNLEALKEALQMSDVLVKASLPILTAKKLLMVSLSNYDAQEPLERNCVVVSRYFS